MGVRILRARVKRLEQIADLGTITFVWDESDEVSEDAVLDLLRDGATVEDFRVTTGSRSGLMQAGLGERIH